MNKDHSKFRSAVHLFLVRDERILLMRRFNTGFEDGKYGVPAGHIDRNESASEAMIREAKEETGITISIDKLKMVQVMHRKSTEEYIDFFFEVKEWHGTPNIGEPDKCDDLNWFATSQLPPNIIPYLRVSIENYGNKIPYSEFGWNNSR